MMMRIFSIGFSVIAVLLVSIAVSGQVHEGLEIKDYPWRMHAYNYPRTPGGDSVVVAKYNEVWYFNTDSLCHYMVTDRRSVYTEDLVHYYYWEVLTYASEQQIENVYRTIKDAAKKYKSTILNDEADYMKIHTQFYSKLNSGGVTDDEAEAAVHEMHEYIKRFIFKNDKARHLEYLAEPYNMYRDVGNYARMFNYIPSIVDLLKQINPKDYLSFYYVYYHIGSDYYNFRDYERAVLFLKKALHDKPTHFADRSDLRARLVLAKYYAGINQLDSSDYYYRSLYDDTNTVRFRPNYDIYAATGIAKNLIRRGMHNEAMTILKRWLSEAIKERLRNEMFEIYVAMGRCFLAEKQLHSVKEMIDSVNALIQQYRNVYFQKEKLYELMLHYSLETGQTDMAYRYSDSMKMARNIHEQRTDAMIILRSEQEVHEAKIAANNEQQQRQKILFQISVVIILLILIALTVITYLYRQKHKAWNDLVQKNLQWANQNNYNYETLDGTGDAAISNIVSNKSTPTAEDHKILEQVHLLMLKGEFKNSKLTIETLAKKINANRNSLSHAINVVTGKNFNVFINEYRIKEALKLISKNRNLYIDELFELVGFQSRTPFYMAFKQITGLSPKEFRDKLN
ncbi:MAG: helix-turn-helix domain-containing protein [Prevotellaceae bacterium]|nr:helix-turn-helix domain-containing protein [Prevotellaceae bacterium]